MNDNSFAEQSSNSREQVIRFGSFELWPHRRLLCLDAEPVRLGSRAFELLLVLVDRAGSIVPAAELMRAVWGSVTVEEANLRVQVGALRKVLAPGAGGNRMIDTVALKGYSFVAPVSRELAPEGEQPTALTLHNLPERLTRLVGREDSLNLLVSRLEVHRLVTVTGAGGIGKTALAVAAARRVQSSVPDGVCFVDFSSLVDSSRVAAALGSALSISVLSEEPITGVLAFLRGKQTLLVLDTCEHVIDAIVKLVETLLTKLPGLRVLATSREALRAEGESVHRLSSLALPPSGVSATDAAKYAAVELFTQQVRSVQPQFELNEITTAFVVRICRGLGGLPLSLELAAARVDELGLQQVATRLDAVLDLLTQGRRTALPRHRTLTATLDWSYELLSPDEQTLLQSLSIFRGSFDVEAAAAVAAIPTPAALFGLASLFAKSMLIADIASDVVLYRLLDTTRAYGRTKLIVGAALTTVSGRHADQVEADLERAEMGWSVDDADVWLGRYARLMDDVRGALDWAMSASGDPVLGARLTAQSSLLWFALSQMDEYAGRIERAMQVTPLNAPIEAILWDKLGHAIWHTRVNVMAMKGAFTKELEIAQGAGLVDAELRAYWGQLLCAVTGGDYQEAVAVLGPLGVLADTIQDPRTQLMRERMSSIALHFAGEHAAARHFCERVLGGSGVTGRKADEKGLLFDHAVIARAVLARVMWMQGMVDQARAIAAEGVRIARSVDHALSLCFILANAAIPIAYWRGDRRDADDFSALLLTTAEQHSFRMWIAFAHSFQLVQRDSVSTLRPTLHPGVPVLLLDTVATIDPRFASDGLLLRAERGEAGWSTPELLRIKATRLLQKGPEHVGSAEGLLLRSLHVAREQHALAWELRSAISLADLWLQQGRSKAAFEVLAPVQARFAEGFETEDLMRATTLLRTLKVGADAGLTSSRFLKRSKPESGRY